MIPKVYEAINMYWNAPALLVLYVVNVMELPAADMLFTAIPAAMPGVVE